MTHPIYVCLDHELTFHSAPVCGRHGTSEHSDGSGMSELMANGTIIEIGTCEETNYCEKKRLLQATQKDLFMATEQRPNQIQTERELKKQIEEAAKK